MSGGGAAIWEDGEGGREGGAGDGGGTRRRRAAGAGRAKGRKRGGDNAGEGEEAGGERGRCGRRGRRGNGGDVAEGKEKAVRVKGGGAVTRSKERDVLGGRRQETSQQRQRRPKTREGHYAEAAVCRNIYTISKT